MPLKTYKVQLTKPWQLLTFMLSSIGIFFLANFIFQKLDLELFGVVLSLLVSVIYFFVLRKGLIHTNELYLGENEVFLGDISISFQNIVNYKTHGMKGAGLKLRMKDGKIIRLSSNDNFCNAGEFVRFVNDFERRVGRIPEITKVKSFGETNWGLYLAIFSTALLIVVIFLPPYRGEHFEFSLIGMSLVSLTTLWSGIEIRKTLLNKK